MNFLNWSIDTKPQKIQDIGVTNEEEEDISCFPINNSTIFEKKNTMPRYFLSEEENRKTGKLCLFCRNPGHLVRDCREKDISCGVCNKIHDPTRCPANEVCFTCYNLGHRNRECPNERMKRYCSYCDSHEHAIIECTRVWRKYIFMDGTSDRKRQYTRMKYGCYNCGSGAHFGDSCKQLTRFNRGVSAFNSKIVQVVMNKQRSMRSDDSSNDDVPRRVDKIYHSRAKDLYEIEAKQNNRYRPSSPIKKTKNAHKTVPLKDVKKGRLSFPEEYHDHDKQFTDKQKVKKSVINFGKFSAINPYNNFNKSTDRKK